MPKSGSWFFWAPIRTYKLIHTFKYVGTRTRLWYIRSTMFWWCTVFGISNASIVVRGIYLPFNLSAAMRFNQLLSLWKYSICDSSDFWIGHWMPLSLSHNFDNACDTKYEQYELICLQFHNEVIKQYFRKSKVKTLNATKPYSSFVHFY